MASVGHEACLEMFSTRLLRKAYRPERRHGKVPEDVYQCETEFKGLVRIAEETQPMDRGQWHVVCNDFSDKWEHVCHWVHPSRLADFLTENLNLDWVGEYPPRPDASQKAKMKSNIKAQRFRCAECGVICNSYSQYMIHSQGTKHADALQQKIKAEAALGRTYTSPGAIPLDSATDQPSGEAGQPQAYFKREKVADGSSDTCSTAATTPQLKPQTPSAMPPRHDTPQQQQQQQQQSQQQSKSGPFLATSRSKGMPTRMAAITAFLAFTMPLEEMKPKQHDPYSFNGGYGSPGAEQQQQQQQHQQGRSGRGHPNTNSYSQGYQYYYNDYYGNEQCEEEIYSGYAGYSYDGGFQYDYDYSGFYEEPSSFTGGRPNWWNNNEYPSSYVGSAESQVSNNDEICEDDDDEDDEEEEQTNGERAVRAYSRRRQSYGGLERAWTTPEGSDHDYFTDGEDQYSESSSRSSARREELVGRRTSSMRAIPRSASFVGASSIKTSHSSQDFEVVSNAAASSETDTVTVRSMECKVDELVQTLEHETTLDAANARPEHFSGHEPEVLSEVVLRACAFGSAFSAAPETQRPAEAAKFVQKLPEAAEVMPHLVEDLLAVLEDPPAVLELTEEMEPVQVAFVEEKNEKAVTTYLEAFCLAAHLFAAGLLGAGAFNSHFAAFLNGLTANSLRSSRPVVSFSATRLPQIFALLESKGLLASVQSPDSLCKKDLLPVRLQKALCAVH